jgi:hypothetical protein
MIEVTGCRVVISQRVLALLRRQYSTSSLIVGYFGDFLSLQYLAL